MTAVVNMIGRWPFPDCDCRDEPTWFEIDERTADELHGIVPPIRRPYFSGFFMGEAFTHTEAGPVLAAVASIATPAGRRYFVRVLAVNRDTMTAAVADLHAAVAAEATAPQIDVEQINTREGVMFIAHGPDGHRWLIKRLTREAAAADGLAYFLAGYCRDDRGRWCVANPDGTPYRREDTEAKP